MPSYPTLVLPPPAEKFRPSQCYPSYVVPITAAAGAFLTAASVTIKAVIESRANVRIAEIEAETERTRIREAAVIERERLRQQTPSSADS